MNEEQRQSRNGDDAQLRAFINAVQAIAFEIPACNPYTPRLVQLCQEARREFLGQRSESEPRNGLTDHLLIERASLVLADVKFGDYTFEVREGHGGVFLRASYLEPDVYTGEVELQQTRKWLLSPHMTKSEIVQTAFKCCWTSFEHRCREGFLYKGRRVFGPHFDVDDLWNLCDDRENAGGRKEP